MSKRHLGEQALVVHLLKIGRMTPAEISKASDISIRQIYHWAELAGIDWRQARQDYCSRAWRQYRQADFSP